MSTHAIDPRRARRALLGGAVSLSALAFLGCGKKQDDGTAPTGDSLPPLSFRDDTPNLLLTWIDDKGETHTELHPPDVPAGGRRLVRVVVSDREDGTRDLFYVSDLDVKLPGGEFSARAMRRSEWEGTIEERRHAFAAKHAPPPPPTGSAGPAEPKRPRNPAIGVTVIIYGADWCHPCHQAAAYLEGLGVPHVVKNIEEDEAAAREMNDKLERIGRRGGSIPIIDVAGQILVGYSRSEIDRALKRASAGTML
ncbi:MAG: glutaredoxin family protein [Polyangiaceae bacterium]